MKVTVIKFYHFEPIYVVGKIDKKIKEQIQRILNSMSYDEYGGYAPVEQKKRKIIEDLVKIYEKPKVETMIQGVWEK